MTGFLINTKLMAVDEIERYIIKISPGSGADKRGALLMLKNEAQRSVALEMNLARDVTYPLRLWMFLTVFG